MGDPDYRDLSREALIEQLEAQLRDRDEHQRLLHELATYQIELEAQNQALRESQGQLEESRSRYVDLYDFAPIAYCTFDRNAVVLEINLTGAAMLGMERSRIIGRPFRALARLDDPEALIAHLRATLEASIPSVGEIGFAAARGPRVVQLISTPARNLRGPTTSCRTAMLDITQQRLAERDARAVHVSEQRLRRRVERIELASAEVTATLATPGSDLRPLLQVIVDQARMVADAELAALGIGGDAERRFDPWVVSGVTPEEAAAIGDPPRGVGLLGAVIGTGGPIRLRDVREAASFSGLPPHHPAMTSFLGVPVGYLKETRGHLYLANKRGGAEFTEDDQTAIEMFAERVGVALEIARLRQIEARLYRAAQVAVAARDSLLAFVTHDLHNYLGAIRVSADVLTSHESGEPRQRGYKQVELIGRTVRHMARLIEGLRDATMIETGRFTVAATTEDVAALVAEAVETLAPQAEAKSLRLTAQIADDLPAVPCDRGRVLQVIANLVGNAIKFTPERGDIRIVAARAHGAVRISIHDTGPGIAAPQLPFVFDRYWRGEDAGTGLGLFISKGIVEAHGGRIWAESEAGTGSAFHFTLPLG